MMMDRRVETPTSPTALCHSSIAPRGERHSRSAFLGTSCRSATGQRVIVSCFGVQEWLMAAGPKIAAGKGEAGTIRS